MHQSVVNAYHDNDYILLALVIRNALENGRYNFNKSGLIDALVRRYLPYDRRMFFETVLHSDYQILEEHKQTINEAKENNRLSCSELKDTINSLSRTNISSRPLSKLRSPYKIRDIQSLDKIETNRILHDSQKIENLIKTKLAPLNLLTSNGKEGAKLILHLGQDRDANRFYIKLYNNDRFLHEDIGIRWIISESVSPPNNNQKILQIFDRLSDKFIEDYLSWNKERLKTAQQQLKLYGYYKGDIDGIYGPFTESAIESFQNEYNLHQTGKIDLETAKKLLVTK